MRDQKIAVVFGDGRLAAECTRVIADHDGIAVGAVIHHDEGEFRWSSQTEKVCQDLQVPHVAVDNVNDETAVRTLKEIAPDIVFSANNWDVIRAEVLGIPADGILNFHNGPLPEYRGVNAPSWAIFNRERRYGVSWHYVAERVDAGDLVATAAVDIGEDETAISLIFKCIDAGIGLLPKILEQYLGGGLAPVPQEGKGRYYRAADVPNDGYLDFTTDFEQLSALVRALTFRPFPSPITGPRIRTSQYVLPVAGISRERAREPGEPWAEGRILGVDDGAVLVCASDSLVRVQVLKDAESEAPIDRESAADYGLVEGEILPGRA